MLSQKRTEINIKVVHRARVSLSGKSEGDTTLSSVIPNLTPDQVMNHEGRDKPQRTKTLP